MQQIETSPGLKNKKSTQQYKFRSTHIKTCLMGKEVDMHVHEKQHNNYLAKRVDGDLNEAAIMALIVI
jgi:hypothetical protein